MHCNSTQCLARATVFGVFINTIHTNCIHGIAPLRQYWMLTKCSPWLEAPTYCLTLNDTFLCVSASVFIIVQLQLANENGLTILTSSTHTHIRCAGAQPLTCDYKQNNIILTPFQPIQVNNTTHNEEKILQRINNLLCQQKCTTKRLLRAPQTEWWCAKRT